MLRLRSTRRVHRWRARRGWLGPLEDLAAGSAPVHAVLADEVARPHLDALADRPTRLAPQQSEFLGVNVGGCYKPDQDRY